jgi:MFS family permease
MEIARPSRDVRPLDHAPGVRLHRGTGMLAAALVLALVFNVANLPAPLYVIYRDRFGFSELMLTVAYAVYMIGSVIAMTAFGRLSDQIGRRPVLFASIGLAAASTVVLLATVDTAMLLAGRVLSGLAGGLTATACTAWIAELQPNRDRRIAALFSTGGNLAGLALGPLIAGVLAQYTPYPLALPYVVYLAGLIVPALVVWTVHETVRDKRSLNEISLRPRIGVPAEIAAQFIAPAVSAFVAFAVMGFYSALIPTLLEQALKIESHAIGGAVIFFFFAVGVGAIALSGSMSSRAAMLTGVALLVPGVALLELAQVLGSMSLLLASSAIGGVASAFGYRGSLQVINEIAPSDRRAETVSTYLLACYCGVSLPVIGIGLLSGMIGAQAADLVFAGLLCLLALAAFATDRRYGRASHGDRRSSALTTP